jgi:hypothetical protein
MLAAIVGDDQVVEQAPLSRVGEPGMGEERRENGCVRGDRPR